LRSNVIEFPNGEYVYIEYRDGKIIAGGATNVGIIPEYEMDYDHDASVDSNLEALYDMMIEQNPSLLDESLEEKTLTEGVEKYDRIQALANHLGVSPDDITEVYGNEYETPEGDYLVVTTHEAYNLAVEDVKNCFDEMGIESFTPGFQDWILRNAVNTEWFEEAFRESTEAYVNDIEYEDGRLEEEMLDAGVITEEDVEDGYDLEEAKERYVEYLMDGEDPVDHFRFNFGDNYFSEMVKRNDLIDIDAVAEECVDVDGVAHFLARYDGEEIDLGSGLYAYRTN
jgi:hypothetical protein